MTSTTRSLHTAWKVVAAVALVAFVAAPSHAQSCAGDCNDDAEVTIEELVTGVNIALEEATADVCPNVDGNADGVVTIDELVAAVHNALFGCPLVPTPTPEPSGTPTPEPSSTPTATPTPTSVPPPIPTSAAELIAWLQAGNYLDWPAESAPHPSAGPHFGTVRSFLNPVVFASLEAGSATHPAGAALVKELYGSGGQVQGWSVMVKVQVDSAGGAGWYWLERFGGTTYAASRGNPVCTGCHSLGNDYVRSPFPLQ